MGISLFIQIFFIILLSPLTITNKNGIHAQAQCLGSQKTLLLELKNQLVFNSSDSTKLAKWNQSDDDCCRWKGVGCDDAGHVISLKLPGEGISGGLNESSSLFGLKYLEKLDLSENSLDGSEIPREFHKLTHLTSLALTSCSLTGYFPQVIFHLPNLQSLFLYDNPSLGGTIPQFSQNNSFQRINLGCTNFSGSLPDSVGNLRSLSYLEISFCIFSGPIPHTLGNLTRLKDVGLSNNFFTGSISSILFQHLSDLIFLDLSYNSLSGTIPTSIFSTLPSLDALDLSNNQFSGQVSEFPLVNISSKLSSLRLSSNRLESPIPNSFFSFHNLQELFLSHNLFNETFQLEKILSLPNLQILDLSGNNLSLDDSTSSSENFTVRKTSSIQLDLSNNRIAGEIPSWIWEMVTGPVSSLNLCCNLLVGLQKPYTIPPSFNVLLLDLHSNKLRDELPSSLIQGARYAYFSNNMLSGSIPTSICNSTVLQVLDLSNNSLSGWLPDCLFEEGWDSPEVLILGRNRISGYIPDKFSIYSNLISLDLSDNNLVGDVPLSLSNCSRLEVLNLSGNKLGGTVPPDLTMLESLATLNLGRNNITGHVPNFAANCNLKYLVLNNNNLTGEIPASLANCKVLEVMNVGGNRIDGSFPCMQLPSSLHVLVLRSNRFHGDITCHNKSWPNLKIIDITSNNFSGFLNPFNFSTWRGMMRDTVTNLSYKNLGFDNFAAVMFHVYYREEVTLTIKGVERKLYKIWPDFTSIDFSNNNFHGGIPDSIGGLDGLYFLNLSHNSLTGTIPKSFGKLRQLESLDLSVNRLTGKIPEDIARITFLTAMNVSHNELVGKIPVSTQIQSFPADSFEGNLGLCGLPLNISCSNTPVSPPPPPPQGNEESGREIEWAYVFASAGYAVGLGSFCWVLLFCKSFRYKYFEKIDDFYDNTFYRRHPNKRSDRRRRRAIRNEVRR